MAPVRKETTSATVMARSAEAMTMVSVAVEAVDVAVEVLEVSVEAEAAVDPEVAEASVSLTASPETREPASSPRRRGEAVARATGETSRMTSRYVVRSLCNTVIVNFCTVLRLMAMRPTTPPWRSPPRRVRRLRTRKKLLRIG